MKHERLRIFRNRKGFNDIVILVTIICIFLISGFVIPYLSDISGESYSEYDTDNYISSVKDDADSVSSLNAFKVILTILKLASFDIGNTLDLPLFIRLMYGILSLTFIVVIARNIWIGGGG